METCRKWFAAAGAVALITLALSQISPGPVAAQNQAAPVQVVNSPAEPVPVTGSVKVSNSPSVQLAPGSNVCIDPLCNVVRVGNDIGTPVPVQSVDSSEEVLAGQSVLFREGVTFGSRLVYTVPAGKRLIVDHIWARADLPRWQTVLVGFLVTLPPPRLLYRYPVLMQNSVGFREFQVLEGVQDSRITAAGGQELTLECSRSSSTGTGSARCSFIGRLVNEPPAAAGGR